MHTKHDLGGTSSPVANIRGSDLRPSLIDVIALGTARYVYNIGVYIVMRALFYNVFPESDNTYNAY